MSKRSDAIQPVIDELVAAGIPVDSYKSRPRNQNLQGFFINVTNRNIIKIWTGSDEVDVRVTDTDKQVRQGVLRIREPEQTLTYEYDVTHDMTSGQISRRFPIGVPENTTFKIDTIPQAPTSRPSLFRNVRVSATIPRHESTFLVGIDEEYPFVCQLPRPVKTVSGAHKALRPKGVPANALRQGEFFLVPVADEMEKTLDERYLADLRIIGPSPADLANCSNWDGPDSDHIASNAMYRGSGMYVCGFITHPRHQTLFLNRWHKVVRNLEVPNPNQTWD